MTEIINAYHGSNANFDKFDQNKSRIPNDFFGGGVAYFTDNIDLAKQYATAMQKKSGGQRVIYDVTLKLKKIFDVDDVFAGADLSRILKGIDLDKFARGAGLLTYGTDPYKVLGDLQSGRIQLTGTQVFKGLSGGMVNTAKAREHLKVDGYDSLRYNGGLNMNMAIRHNVYLVYNVNDIKINSKEILPPAKTLRQFKEV